MANVNVNETTVTIFGDQNVGIVKSEPTVDYRREFPETDIRRHTRRLSIIADAFEAGIGGHYGPANLLCDALVSTEFPAGILRRMATKWELLSEEAP